MSESSFGSTYSRAQPQGERGTPDDPLENSNHLTTGLFGVLYTVSKEKRTTPVVFVILKLVLDFLQLFLVMVNPQYDWKVDGRSAAWRVISFIQLNNFMSARGYTFFLVFMYIMVVFLALCVLLCLWVAWSFQNNRFDHVWPIKILRVYSSIFFNLFDIASMSLFLIALDCQYFDTDNNYHNQQFPEIMCWDMPHLIHVTISSVSLLLFVALASLMIMGDMEFNSLTKNTLAVAHSKVDVIGFLIKVLMTCVGTFVTNLKWMSVMQCFLAVTLFYMYWYWEPFIYNIPNHVRVASYAAVAWCSVMLVFLRFMPAVDAAEDPDVYEFRDTITWVMIYGLAPAALWGFLASYIRLYYMQVVIPRKFKLCLFGTRLKYVFKFQDPREVEIIGRIVRKWIDEDTVEPEAILAAEQVLKAGMTMLPNCCFLTILYSSFLIEVQGSYQSGYTQLQSAKKQDPSLLERFAIFSREQEHTQKKSGASGVGGDSNVDLVSYVEFQRNHRLVLRTHKEALYAVRHFWQCLLHSKVTFVKLSKAIARIELQVRQAERVYRMVLERHTSSIKILRLYARFLQDVKNDPWSAAKWFGEAERLEADQESSKERDVLKGTMGGDNFGFSTMNDSIGVVICNAHSEIQMANRALYTLLGFKKNELKGRNLSILIPPPFHEHHTAYVRNYVATGKGAILGTTSDAIAMGKDRSVIPVKLTVHKVSGIGEDSIFMGIFEPVEADESTAKAWVVSNGTFASVDSTFTDWFGFKPAELIGSGLSTVVMDVKKLDEHIRSARERVAAAVHSARAPAPAATPPKAIMANPIQKLSGVISSFTMKGSKIASQTSQAGGHLDMLLPERSAQMSATQPRAHIEFDMGPTIGAVPMLGPEQHRRASVQLQSLALLQQHVERSSAARLAPFQSIQSPTPGLLEDVGPMNMQGLQFKHKFCDLICKVDITLKIGTIGNQQFNELVIKRSADTAPCPTKLMFTCDRKGRIVHVTEELATMLNTTAQALIGGNTTHMLDLIIPQPYAQLHHTLIQDAPPKTIPVRSCRSGLSQCLLRSEGLENPTLTPFKITIHKKLMVPSAVQTRAEYLHVATLQQRTLEQALDERRIKLLVDAHGNVLESSSTEPSLFGFEPEHLIGKKLNCILDILRVKDSDAVASSGRRTSYAQPEDDLSLEVLMELAQRSVDTPGLSWRVGVSPPLDESELQELGPMGAAMLAQRTMPAIMTVAVHFKPVQRQADPSPASAAANEASEVARAVRHRSIITEEELCALGLSPNNYEIDSPNLRTMGRRTHRFSSLGLGDVFYEVMEGTPPTGKRATQRFSSTGRFGSAVGSVISEHEEEEGEDHAAQERKARESERPKTGASYAGGVGSNLFDFLATLTFEIELWRSDLLTGLVELDAHGKVLHTDTDPLCPSGLVLGLPMVQVQDAHVSEILGIAPTTQVRDLFNEIGTQKEKKPSSMNGGRKDQAAIKRKGGLRTANTKASRGEVGPINEFNLTHIDGAELQIKAQAVWKATGTAYLILTLNSPRVARTDFRDWLRATSQVRQEPREQLGVSPGRAMHRASTMDKANWRALLALSMAAKRFKQAGAKAAAIKAATFQEPDPSPTWTAPQPETRADEAPVKRPNAPVPQLRMGELSVMPSRLGFVPEPAITTARDIALDLPPSARQEPEVSKPTPAPAILPRRSMDSDHGISKEAISRTAAWVLSDGQEMHAKPAMHGNALFEATPGVERSFSQRHSRMSRHSRPAYSVVSGDKDEEKNENGSDEPAFKPDAEDDDDHPPRAGRGRRRSRNESARDHTDVDDVEEMGDEAGALYADYKRGKRFRKLCKLLGNVQAMRVLRRFQLHTLVCVALLFLVRSVVFAIMVVLLQSMQESVDELGAIGLASQSVHEIVLDIKYTELMLANRTVAGLRNFDDGPSGAARSIGYVNDSLAELRYLHRGTFYGFHGAKEITTRYGLRDLWSQPSLPVVDYLSTTPALTSKQEEMSLWELGNQFIAAAATFVDNAYAWNGTGLVIGQTAPVLFAKMNGLGSLWGGYQKTLNAFVNVTAEDNVAMNNVHLVIMALEGVLLTWMSVIYMWRMAQAVDAQRYNMYGVFMSVPLTLIRNLAVKPVQLEEEDDEDEDEETPGDVPPQDNEQDPGEEHETAQAQPAGPITVTTLEKSPVQGGRWMQQTDNPFQTKDVAEFLTKAAAASKHTAFSPDVRLTAADSSKDIKTQAVQNPSDQRLTTKLRVAMFSVFALGFKVADAPEIGNSKGRVLHRSYHASLWLIWPYVLWGVLVVALNAVRYQSLSHMGSSIALLNVISFAHARTDRVVYDALVLITANTAQQPDAAATLKMDLSDLEAELEVMMYGKSNSTSELEMDHFWRVDKGVGGRPESMNLLFSDLPQCLCVSAADCQPSTSSIYQVVTFGLGPLYQEFTAQTRNLANSAFSTLSLNHTAFRFLWTVNEFDLQGGMGTLAQVYLSSLKSMYSNTVMLHVVQFVLSMVLALVFYLFMLRPFLQETRGESKRIAELLSQLPQEVDVEGIVSKQMGVPLVSPGRSAMEAGMAAHRKRRQSMAMRTNE